MSVPALSNVPSMIYAPRAPGLVPAPTAHVGSAPSSQFEQVLAQGIERVNTEQVEANTQVEQMVSSQGANIHEAMVALSRAEITLRLGVKIGQKLVGAYQELQRIQI